MVKRNSFLNAKIVNEEIYNIVRNTFNTLNRNYNDGVYNLSNEDKVSVYNLSQILLSDCEYIFNSVSIAIKDYQEKGLLGDVDEEFLHKKYDFKMPSRIEPDFESIKKTVEDITNSYVIIDRTLNSYLKREITEDSVQSLIDNKLLIYRQRIYTFVELIKIQTII